MAPTNYHTGFYSRSELAQRAPDKDCSGWNCLSDATQVGIILIVVAFVGVIGYLYWRFKVKPGFPVAEDQNSERTAAVGHWEITRRDPNSISITISREARPRPPTPAATESRTSPPARTTKQNARQPQQDENSIELMPSRLGLFGVSETHLLPPPPPLPSFWTAPVLPTIPPRVTFESPAFFPPPPFPPPPFPPPPPPPQYSNIGLSATAPSLPQGVPPPYLGYAAPQPHQAHNLNQATAQPPFVPQPYQAQGARQVNVQQPFAHQSAQAQDPNQGNAQPPFAPQPGPASDRRARGVATSQSAPVASGRNPRRGWFSFLRRSPTVGHARTLSSPSLPESEARPPSPPSPVSSSSSDEEDDTRRPSDVQRQQTPPQAHPPTSHRREQQRASASTNGQPLPPQRPRKAREARDGAREQGQHDSGHQAQPDSSVSSGYLNSSVEARVHDEDELPHHPGTNHRSPPSSSTATITTTTTTSSSSRRPHHPPLLPSSSTTPNLRPNHPSSPRPPTPPSPDMGIPPAEPRRARVAFTLPRDARAARIGSLPTTDARRAADAQRRQQQGRRRREPRPVGRSRDVGEEEEGEEGWSGRGSGSWEERDAPGDEGADEREEREEGKERRRGEEEGRRGLVETVVGAFWRARRALREE